MSKPEDFVIENGVLKSYRGSDTDPVIPEGVVRITDNAFCVCDKVTSITIPASVTDIEIGSFRNCANLVSFHVAPENPVFADIEGVLFNKNLTTLIQYPINGKSDYCVPDNVTKLLSQSFANCASLVNITLPPKIIDLYSFTFAGCSRLKAIQIPQGVQGIEQQCFYECSRLSNVSIPDSVTYIANGAFMRCSNLESITLPPRLSKLGHYAFAECPKLTEVHTESSSIQMLRNTFDESSKAYFYAPNMSLNEILDQEMKVRSVVNFCDAIVKDANLHFPKAEEYISYIKHQRKKLYPLALEHEALLQVMIQGSMIPKADISELTEKASHVSSPIKAALLAYQEQILPLSARMKKEEEKIESELTGILSVSEAKKSWTFENTDNGIVITGYKGAEKEIVVPNGIGKQIVTAIGESAFSPSAYRIPKAVKAARSEITSVSIPEGITSIGRYIFKDCANLDEVFIPNSVSEIDPFAFEGFENLHKLQFSADNQNYELIDGVLFQKQTKKLVRYLRSADGPYEIPEGISEIGNNAFDHCSSLTGITFPKSLTKVGANAFTQCSNLSGSISSESITEIGAHAFRGCAKLQQIQLTGDLREINDFVFCDCKSLTSVRLSDHVTSIGESAFSGCSKLKAIDLSGELIRLDAFAFSNCRQLTAVIIPNGVEEIGEKTFENCRNLNSVTIPESVSNIAYDAFLGCIQLTVHAVSGSYAESFAKKAMYTVVN